MPDKKFTGITPGVLKATLFASVGALLFGLDNGWWGTVLGLPVFNRDFGTLVTEVKGVRTISLSATEQSVGTSMGSAGIMIGCVLATPINRYYGRKAGVAMLSVLSIIGVIIQLTSVVHGHRYWQLVAGKIINSIAMGIACNVVPTYQNELAPPKWRGAIINLYQTVQIVGVIIATVCVYQLSARDSDIAWLVPVGLQLFAPVFLLGGLFWMPESPRWLVWNGRDEEARAALFSLNGTAHGYDADAEVELLRSAFEAEKLMKKPELLDAFRGSDRRRTLIATGVQCLQQAQGSSYMTNYIVLFLISLGLTDVFLIVMILYLAAILFSFYLPDYIGRRIMLMGGAAVCGCALLVVAILNVAIVPITISAQKAGLGLIFIWYFHFGLVWSPLVWITCAEVASVRAREPTLSIATFSGFSVSLIITLVSPYLQNAEYGNLGSSIGFIWGGFTIISIPFVYFFIPEMKGLTLEQIDYLFESRTPTRKFSAALCPDGLTLEQATPHSEEGSLNKGLEGSTSHKLER